jgi:hypothetical protein
MLQFWRGRTEHVSSNGRLPERLEPAAEFAERSDLMIIRLLARLASISATAAMLLAIASASHAQQPSTAAIALAKEIFVLKDAVKLYDPVVPSVIENVRQLLQQRNPMVGKDLNDVAAKVRADLAPRTTEVHELVIRLYAKRFNEA